MSYSSAEKRFYQHQYKGALQVQSPLSPAEIEAQHFAQGRRYHLVAKELSRTRQYGTALEIGCASGECIGHMARTYSFQRAIGIDIAFPDDMRQRIDGVEFIQANSNDALPLDDSSVDVLVAMMVIEHLFDPFAAFKEVRRLLSKDGIAFINLPLVTSLKNRWRLLTGQVPVTSVAFGQWFLDQQWDGNHLHYFSMNSIRQLAGATQLRVIAVAGVGRFHQLKTLAPQFLANEISFIVERA
jgi:ubiquinone/menaquinone biosynthesis C-methylase UbiE